MLKLFFCLFLGSVLQCNFRSTRPFVALDRNEKQRQRTTSRLSSSTKCSSSFKRMWHLKKSKVFTISCRSRRCQQNKQNVGDVTSQKKTCFCSCWRCWRCCCWCWYWTWISCRWKWNYYQQQNNNSNTIFVCVLGEHSFFAESAKNRRRRRRRNLSLTLNGCIFCFCS